MATQALKHFVLNSRITPSLRQQQLRQRGRLLQGFHPGEVLSAQSLQARKVHFLCNRNSRHQAREEPTGSVLAQTDRAQIAA